MKKNELINKLVEIYDYNHKHGRAMDFGIGYDFKKKLISLDIDGYSYTLLLKDIADNQNIGDKKAGEIWSWVKNGPNSG